jgi:hypothetical protein
VQQEQESKEDDSKEENVAANAAVKTQAFQQHHGGELTAEASPEEKQCTHRGESAEFFEEIKSNRMQERKNRANGRSVFVWVFMPDRCRCVCVSRCVYLSVSVPLYDTVY